MICRFSKIAFVTCLVVIIATSVHARPPKVKGKGGPAVKKLGPISAMGKRGLRSSRSVKGALPIGAIPVVSPRALPITKLPKRIVVPRPIRRTLGTVAAGMTIVNRRVPIVPPETPSFTGISPMKVLVVLEPTTVVVSQNGTARRVRLLGLDVADTSTAKATQELTRIVQGRNVYLHHDDHVADRDADGVLVGYLYRVEDSLLVNQYAIAEGIALATTSFSYQHRSLFEQSEALAQQQEKGIWAINSSSPLSMPSLTERTESR